MAYKDIAVLLIDPYNDYIHPSGKVYSLCQDSLEASHTIAHLKTLVAAARANKIPIFYCLHQPWKPGNFDHWNRIGPFQQMLKDGKVCEEGTWGAGIYEGLEPDLGNGDIIVGKHWNASSFQNTDLDYQLKQRDITKLVTAGMTCNQCLELTSRTAIELGYKVTVTTNATAGFTTEQKEVSQKLLWPVFFESLVTVEEWAEGLEKKVRGG